MGFQTAHCPGPHTKIVLLCFEKQPEKNAFPKLCQSQLGLCWQWKGGSLPSHRLSLPGSGRAAGLKSVRTGCWAAYKNKDLYKDTGNHSHLLWEPEGSIFLVIKGINSTQAKVKSQITYTDYPPLLREPDKNYGLISGYLNSECHSNIIILAEKKLKY